MIYKIKTLFTLFFITITFSSFAQLDDFGLDIVVTDETCDDNATLTFDITNPTPGSTFLFTVYLLPDTTNPIAVTTDTFVNNLDSGSYLVIALQTFNAESNVQEATVTVVNAIEPLSYTISSSNQNCSVGGQIEITTITGTAAEYEIISGPEIRPLQTSNIFEGLPPGTYNIRVFDVCGQGLVTTYTLVLESAVPVISMPEYEEVITTDCDSAVISNIISYPEGVTISYPLTVTYTIYPPNGDPEIVITETYEDGESNSFEVSNEFELYGGDVYTYDIEVTNDCGIQFGNSGMTVNPMPEITSQLEQLPCGDYYFSLNASQYSPPYTLEFINPPIGFNPNDYNADYPGPYTDDEIVYGSVASPVPEGIYEVSLTDACGRVASVEFEIINDIIEPLAVGRNNGCFSELGRIVATIPDKDIIEAEIIDAPDTYTATLPQDVSSNINNNGRLIVNNLPIGDYIIRITDECGNVYEIPVNVPEFEVRGFTITSLAACNVGVGSVRINSGNGSVTAVTLTDAPETYGGTVPQDLSDDISSGVFLIDNLPEGDYIFEVVDVCGIEDVLTVTVVGYNPSDNPFVFIPNCGSFDIILQDEDSVSDEPTYWLQVLLDEENDIWGNPATQISYTEGTVPNEDNSFPLPNNTTTFNLTFNGDFRIVKAFESYTIGNTTKNCIDVLGTFSYLNNPRINNVFSLSCSITPDDVYIDAEGIPPLTYTATTEINGIPFTFDNGSDPTFTGLDPGTYTFKVVDDCGNTSTLSLNISVLPDLVVANEPDDLFICTDTTNGTLFDFDLSELDEIILGDQSSDAYLLTYHLTQDDAETGENPIPDVYATSQPSTTIYARLIHNYISICYDIVSFELVLGEVPTSQLQEFYYVCEDDYVIISAGIGYDSYLWSTGETSESIIVTEPGIYTVAVTEGFCDATFGTEVTISEPATVANIDTEDWTEDENVITISVLGDGMYEYSLDGLIYQDENTFSDLDSGLYTVYIRDINGCGTIQQDVALLNYPKFFTPNGDGINEMWKIPFSWFEEDFEVVIFDRYGKIITGFDSESQGWDGTYNGVKLPSTDYWFLITRQDGRVHKGHFAMVR